MRLLRAGQRGTRPLNCGVHWWRKSDWIAPPVPASTLSYPATVFTTEAGIADMHTYRGGALLSVQRTSENETRQADQSWP
jgi:hypothetical protein